MHKLKNKKMHLNIINSFLALLSLVTATGVFLHDTRVDKAAALAVLPVVGSLDTSPKIPHVAPNELHTHIERGNIARAASILHSSAPGITPRAKEDKKHLLQQYVARGHHAFDSYHLPI